MSAVRGRTIPTRGALLLIGLALIATLSLLRGGGNTHAAPSFEAVQSGLWSDPTTWGHSDVPIPDVSIPGPNSAVVIPSGRTVTVVGGSQQVASLTIRSGGVLQAGTGQTLHIVAAGDIRVEGQALGGPGNASMPAGGVLLLSTGGSVIVTGRVRGGDAGPLGGPGGFVLLRALTQPVENWGTVSGGRGAGTAPGGWVWLDATDSIVRNRGEVRGGPGLGTAGTGGDTLTTATTVDSVGGKFLGGRGGSQGGYGDTYLSARQALLLGTRRTRVAGQGTVLAAGASGLIDLQDVETMALLARQNGIWIMGAGNTRLNLTGNRARFAPLQALGGTVHLWVDAGQRYFDPGTTLADLVAGALDDGPARPGIFPALLLRGWQPARPGTTITWQLDVVNVGNAAGALTLAASNDAGWPTTLTPQTIPTLSPGASTTVTVTIQVPENASTLSGNAVTVVATPVGSTTPPASVRAPLPLASWQAHLPWVGRRGTGTFGQASRARPDALPVRLTWPGEEKGLAVQGATLLVVATAPGNRNVTAADLAYWDGIRWVPIATTADMENFTEDGVWYTLWDTSDIPLSTVHVRARLWDEEGLAGETIRVVTVEHAPVAQASATFGAGGQVVLDASASVDLDGRIAEYAWDLGDGHLATGAVVTHTFSSGTFVVRLTVTDTAGLADEAVYLLDTAQQSWAEQDACGCQSLRLVQQGPSPITLPWEDTAHQVLGLDTAALSEGQMLRLNLAVEATLVPESNARACRVEQSGQVTWRWQEPNGPQERAWRWGGQDFPSGSNGLWGLIGYTHPSALLDARGTTIRWVLGPGWGWRSLGKGLPPDALAGDGVRVDATYRARVSGSAGACTCTWTVTIQARAGSLPDVQITGDCGG